MNLIRSVSPHLIVDSSKAVPQLMGQGQHSLTEWPLPTHVQQCYEANVHLRKAETLWLRQTCCSIRKVSAISILELDKCLNTFLHVGEKECQTKVTKILLTKFLQKLDPVLNAVYTKAGFHLNFDYFEVYIRVTIVKEWPSFTMVNLIHSLK